MKELNTSNTGATFRDYFVNQIILTKFSAIGSFIKVLNRFLEFGIGRMF